MASKVGDEEDAKPDFLKLFPVHSIKRYLQNDADVGRMRKDTEELLVSCSAKFLEKLLKESIGEDNVVSLANLKKTVNANDKFCFLNLESVQDSTAPALKKRKARKHVSKAASKKKPRETVLLDVKEEVTTRHADTIGSMQEGIELNEDDDEYD